MNAKIKEQIKYEKMVDSFTNLINNNKEVFSMEEMRNAMEEAFKIKEVSTKLPKKLKISARKGIIVYMERMFQKGSIRSDFTLDQLIRKVKVIYNITSADKQKLKDVDHIHPYDPCYKFKECYHLKRGYRDALNDIIVLEKSLKLEEEVYESIDSILEEVIICSK
ncbi:hypothetical protein [Mesonia maritima]|uniref:Uncharacterized protein n=1 Tax=Mesonia maritima TaxID=1793873 RepID=A0ABU1K9K0_9FLAO|nr:hypothetical protein [Mesonia maritima]MDR6302276.1 hypothetical protein [Mesonia maritima]